MKTITVIFLILFSTFLVPAQAALIEGRVVFGDKPVPGMRVEARTTLDFSSAPVVVSPPTGEDGTYRLVVPAGNYILFARDEVRGLFAFCGRFPVKVGETPVWAGIQAVKVHSSTDSPYDDEYSAAIEGTLLFEGEPLEGAYIHLYLDAGEDLKGQGYRLSSPTGKDGRFAFDGLPESGYYLVARKRATGGRVGPVLEGDYLALYPSLVTAVAGKTKEVRVEAVRKIKDKGDSEMTTEGGAIIRGIVTDPEGNPLSGLHVFAYTDRVIGHQRPEALSRETGPDGRFTVHFAHGGTYFVGARQEYGDSPAPGELFGMYDETSDHGLTLKEGESLDKMHIVAEPITLNGM